MWVKFYFSDMDPFQWFVSLGEPLQDLRDCFINCVEAEIMEVYRG